MPIPSTALALTPNLASFLKSLKTNPIDTSIDNLISCVTHASLLAAPPPCRDCPLTFHPSLLPRLLKRRQIHNSRSCATATAYLLLRVVSAYKTNDASRLIERVQNVGRRLVAAQPREMVVGNIVRRVLGLIRDEAEGDREAEFTLGDAGSESQLVTPRPHDGQSTPSLRILFLCMIY